MRVHLVLAALRAVAVETQSLVGHELPAARVDGGTNGNTAMMALAWVGQRGAKSAENSCEYCAGRGGRMKSGRHIPKDQT